MTGKIPVRIELIADDNGTEGIEVIMELSDFESTGSEIRKNIAEFRTKYLDAIKRAKDLDQSAVSGPHKISTKRRWNACNVLANFNKEISNKFVVINYKQAYARDFCLPMRSIRTYLDFGGDFSEDDILDEIPYSIYAEMVFKINELKRKNMFESEKKRLIDMAKSNKIPNREEYRSQLKTI